MDTTPALRPLLDSSAALREPETLRARMARDGYLLLRGLVPRGEVSRVFAAIAAIARDAGWLRADAPPQAALAEPRGFCVDPEPAYLAVIDEVNRLYAFNALSHHPALLALLRDLLDAPVLVHPKPLIRVIFPDHDDYTTPAHQDFPNIQGTTEVYTAWLALADYPAGAGGLAIARGSHTAGVYDFEIANGAGAMRVCDPLDGRWMGGGRFAAGDVLLFHSLTVHRGLPNRSAHLRLSVDARYQRVADPVNPENLAGPNGAPATWEAVYERWTPAERAHLAWYWRRFALRERPPERTWVERRDALGFALGEQRDPRARSVLLRILMRDPDPRKRARAQRLLQGLANASASPGTTL